MPQEAAEPSSAEGKNKRNPYWGAKPPATQLFLPFAWMRALLVQSFLSNVAVKQQAPGKTDSNLSISGESGICPGRSI